MGVIRKRPAAREDLHEIWSYIASDDVEAADHLVRKVHEAYERLAEYPELGRRREELAARVRSLTIASYVVFYRPLSELDGIEVVRVLHSAQDIRSSRFEE